MRQTIRNPEKETRENLNLCISYRMSKMIFRYLFAARFRFRCTECSYKNLIIRIIALYNNNCPNSLVGLQTSENNFFRIRKEKIKELNHDLNQTTKTTFNLNRDLINDVKIKNVENNHMDSL